MESLDGTVTRLCTQMEAVAALGAHLREDPRVHPDVASRLAEVAALAAPHADTAGAEERSSALGLIRTLMLQALDVLERPDRPPGWTDPDPRVLQAQGRASAGIPHLFPLVDGLPERLAAPGAAFLDVGTGAGWLAIEVARLYPASRVVGVDVFPPALELARGNVVDEGLADRVEVRRQDVSDLDERAVYDGVWLPGPFLPRDVMTRAVAAAARALRPGGRLVAGLYAGPPGALGEALADLRTTRSGGHPWRGPDLLEVMDTAGLVDAREVPRTWQGPIRLLVARRG